MDFITASMLGGILYDIAKSSVISIKESIQKALVEIDLTDEELKTLENLTHEYVHSDTMESFISKLQNNPEFTKIMNQLNQHHTQINVKENSGVIVGTNTGDINFNAK